MHRHRMTGLAAPVRGLDRPASVLVSGASSGIGLAITRRLLGHAHVERVVAVSRSAASSAALADLRARHGTRLRCLDADLTRDADLDALRTALRDVAALHLVVNAAGMLHGDGIGPEKSIEAVDRAALETVFALNAYAPVLLAQALMPQLVHREPVVFASLSARVGSIGDNRTGGWYAYRASKAAQNQLMRTFAIEWTRRAPRSVCLLLHPGTVDTPLSAPFQARVPPARLHSTDAAAEHLLAVIAGCTPADSGRFLAWDGSDVPW